MTTYLTDNNLAKVDRLSMANSMEVRLPFLDLHVARVAFRLPAELKIRGRQTKAGLRQLMGERLPPAVVKAKKKGFSVPLSPWFRGPLRSWIRDEALTPERVEAISILNPEGVPRPRPRTPRGQSEPRTNAVEPHLSGRLVRGVRALGGMRFGSQTQDPEAQRTNHVSTKKRALVEQDQRDD